MLGKISNTVNQIEMLVLQKQEKTVQDPGQHQCLLRYVEHLPLSASCASGLLQLLTVVRFFQCSHEMMCPKLAHESVTPCNFQQKYHPLPLPGVRLSSLKSRAGVTVS